MNEATRSDGKLQGNLGMVFTSSGSSYIFCDSHLRQPDFGLPCLGGDLKSAAIPVLCGNPVTELIISGFSRAGGERGVPLKVVGGGREAFLREDGEEDKCWECSE